MKHNHHIVPKHAGGTDDPSNIIELSVEEHAEAHRKLYEEYGRQEDYYAWKGLSGQVSKKDIMVNLSSSPEGREQRSKRWKGVPKSESQIQKQWKTRKEKYGASGAGKSSWESRKAKYGAKGYEAGKKLGFASSNGGWLADENGNTIRDENGKAIRVKKS